MYAKMNTQSGAASVNAALSQYAVASDLDHGLTVETASLAFPVTAVMPQRLYDWLTNLCLLRNVPLDYLVPDSALLPTESIRFFHLDQTWTDRIIDGVFSAANTGTVDITYSVVMLESVRATLDLSLAALAQAAVPGSQWTPAKGMTGMLIRSELVHRWPDVIVRAFSGDDESTAEMPILRAEPISADVYIAIFAGIPSLVQLREPHVGVRFGVEVDITDLTKYRVEQRDLNTGADILTLGQTAWLPPFSLSSARVVPVKTLGTVSRSVALLLMRPPYVQQFGNSIIEQQSNGRPVTSTQTEQSGYNPDLPEQLNLGPLHLANLSALAARGVQLQKLRKN